MFKNCTTWNETLNIIILILLILFYNINMYGPLTFINVAAILRNSPRISTFFRLWQLWEQFATNLNKKFELFCIRNLPADKFYASACWNRANIAAKGSILRKFLSLQVGIPAPRLCADVVFLSCFHLRRGALEIYHKLVGDWPFLYRDIRRKEENSLGLARLLYGCVSKVWEIYCDLQWKASKLCPTTYLEYEVNHINSYRFSGKFVSVFKKMRRKFRNYKIIIDNIHQFCSQLISLNWIGSIFQKRLTSIL